jgi:hypothetical protein
VIAPFEGLERRQQRAQGMSRGTMARLGISWWWWVDGGQIMESLDYPEFPVHLSVVHVALFTQIIRPSHLRERLINVAKGDQDDTEREAVNFAFIDARLVRCPLPFFFLSSCSLWD